MELRIDNKIINTPIEIILKQLREETGFKYFKEIINKGSNILVTCPHHKDGNENKPSCYIYNADDDPNVMYGTVHCFSCGYKATLWQMVADCFNESEEFGKEWLVDRYGNIFVETYEYLPEIELDKKPKEIEPIDLSKYDYYHPYMWKRGLSKEIVDKFRIGYDPIRDAITFPVWDEHNNLVGVTARNVKNKKFWIPENMEKPVYLLNVCMYEKVPCVYVCESQINALTLWTWGYPAVALFGTGTEHQYEILNKCGITCFKTCFDGDRAGEIGRKKFRNQLKNSIVCDILLPQGKDVNDLTKEEFDALEII